MRRPLRVESRVLRVQRGGLRRPAHSWRHVAQPSTLNPPPSTVNPQPARSGASLIEVMMATLVMGIGVLAVMALFPAAYLRAIQASQLTNAVLLKEQAEVAIDRFHLVSDAYIPRPDDGDINRCIIDPLGTFNLLPDTYGNPPPFPFNPETGAPDYLDFDGTVSISAPDGLPLPLRRLGFQGTNPYQADGYDAITGIDLFQGLPGGTPQEIQDDIFDMVGLPDRWETVFSAIPSSNTATDVSFDLNEVDANDLTDLTNFNELRLVLIGITGKRSEVRIPTAINAGLGTIGWDINIPLPDELDGQDGGDEIAECRVETPDNRFTWMLTVRKTGTTDGSSTDIDCVVFHNRPVVDPEEELVHPGTMPSTNGTLSPSDQLRAVDVGPFAAYSDGSTPPMRKGGYVFDPAHARWYRIEQIVDETSSNATLVLDRIPPNDITVLTIPRGVVAVFSLNKRETTWGP
ncbi:MAG: hypothetical protein KDA52_11130 [Planctomycetaceae bacterium]|nr:hypothetical protein [Planctomycetaceae bacterium]